MLRLLAYAYAVRGPSAEKSLAVDLAIGLMQAVMPLAERAARLPAGPSNPQCNAGMSFITLRDSAALPPGPAARRLFVERFAQLAEGAAPLRASGDARAVAAANQLASLASRASQGFDLTAVAASAPPAARPPGLAAGAAPAARAPEPAARAVAGAGAAAASGAAPASMVSGGVETVQGERLELAFEARRCIHSRFCVTGAPQVFLANVKGPWLHPDAMPVERLVEVAHACPSGAIRYRRKDGAPEEPVPPVNLARGRAGDVHLPVPLRRQRQQALLRRHAHEDRLPVGLTLGRGAQFSPEAFQKMVLRVGAITGLGFCVLKPELTRPGAPPERPPESCAAPMTTVVNWPLIGTVAITGEGGRPPPTNELLRTPPHAAPVALMPPEALNRLTQ